MANTFGRRRAIAIFAAAAGLPLWPDARASSRPTVWKGQALGAPAQLVLHHPDPSRASRLIGRAVAEIARLEAIFSLYLEDSALSELNRRSLLIAPPADLVSLLGACRSFWTATGGAFDPTVQALWSLYRDHFSATNADQSGPLAVQVRQALSNVGFDRVRFNTDRIVMPSGMVLTLNGVAQGYITDKVVDILRQEGVTDSLVDMGEARAIGSRPDGTPWRVGLAQNESSDVSDTVLDIVNKAVATSSAGGFRFDRAGRLGHILDPRSGRTPELYKRLTVIADDATTADALSTAFSLLDAESIGSVLADQSRVAADFITADGVHSRLGSART